MVTVTMATQNIKLENGPKSNHLQRVAFESRLLIVAQSVILSITLTNHLLVCTFVHFVGPAYTTPTI